MIVAYLFPLLPLVIGAILWVVNKKVVWFEWLLGTACAFVIVGIFHILILHCMTTDSETWSGRVIRSIHHPFWHADWWETETYTVTTGSGENQRTETKTRMVHKSEDHSPYWECVVNYGKNTEIYRIDESEFKQHCNVFNVTQPKSVEGFRPHFDHGDKNDYWAENKNNATIPAHKVVGFTNRVKACQSTFSYSSVPKDIPVFIYPESNDWRQSNRLLGTSKKHFSITAWDSLNSELGPRKKVNLIAVGFTKDSMLGQYQEAKWFGGKKNDVVICYGPLNDGKPEWAYCFGWTERNIVKKNLETLFLEKTPNDKLIPLIREEILANYEIKDWKKFDYLSVEPPGWSYGALLGVMLVTQTGFWFWAHYNQFNENHKTKRQILSFYANRFSNMFGKRRL
jgi:hypothetical protein